MDMHKCNNCENLKPKSCFVHIKRHGNGAPDELDKDCRFNNICTTCYPEKKAYYKEQLKKGKEAKRILDLAAKDAAFGLNDGVPGSTSGSGSSSSSSTTKSKIAPGAILKQCTGNALKQVSTTISHARSNFRGVPSQVGAAVLVWDESSDLLSFTSNNPGVMYNQDVLVSALRALRTSKSKKRPPSTPGDTQTPQSNESTLQDDLLSLQTQREALSRRHAAEMGAIDAQMRLVIGVDGSANNGDGSSSSSSSDVASFGGGSGQMADFSSYAPAGEAATSAAGAAVRDAAEVLSSAAAMAGAALGGPPGLNVPSTMAAMGESGLPVAGYGADADGMARGVPRRKRNVFFSGKLIDCDLSGLQQCKACGTYGCTECGDEEPAISAGIGGSGGVDYPDDDKWFSQQPGPNVPNPNGSEAAESAMV